jgi:hypothetical protein
MSSALKKAKEQQALLQKKAEEAQATAAAKVAAEKAEKQVRLKRKRQEREAAEVLPAVGCTAPAGDNSLHGRP